MDLFQPLAGHRVFFTHLLTAFFAYFTNWNLRAEAFSSLFLASINFVLLLLLIRLTEPRVIIWTIVPFAALVFSLRQDRNWLVGLHTVVYFPITFFLAALLIISRSPNNLWRAIAAAALCGAAGISHLSGTLALPIIAITSYLLGYKRWYYIILWLVTQAALIVLLAYNNPIIFVIEKSQIDTRLPNTISLYRPDVMAQTLLVFTGNPFIFQTSVWFRDGLPQFGDSPIAAIIIAVLGLTVAAINLAHLIKDTGKRKWIPWSAVATFGLACGVLLALGRHGALMSVGINYYMQFWYVTLSTPFWCGLIGLMGINITNSIKSAPLKFPLMLFNLLILLLFAVIYTRANYLTLRVTSADYGHGLRLAHNAEEDSCLLSFPSTQDDSCFPSVWNGKNRGRYKLKMQILTMEKHDLGVFANWEP